MSLLFFDLPKNAIGFLPLVVADTCVFCRPSAGTTTFFFDNVITVLVIRVVLKRQFAAFDSLVVVCKFFRQTETP